MSIFACKAYLQTIQSSDTGKATALLVLLLFRAVVQSSHVRTWCIVAFRELTDRFDPASRHRHMAGTAEDKQQYCAAHSARQHCESIDYGHRLLQLLASGGCVLHTERLRTFICVKKLS
jgi:hypothetical protein